MVFYFLAHFPARGRRRTPSVARGCTGRAYRGLFRMYREAFRMYREAFRMYREAFRVYREAFRMYREAFRMYRVRVFRGRWVEGRVGGGSGHHVPPAPPAAGRDGARRLRPSLGVAALHEQLVRAVEALPPAPSAAPPDAVQAYLGLRFSKGWLIPA